MSGLDPAPSSSAILTPAQIAAVAAAAGFADGKGYQGRGLTWAVAVALAESGGKVAEVSLPNADRWHSVDRGLWQINSHWHAEVTDAQALSAASCAAAAFTISHGGLDWHEWSTFKNGLAGAQLARAAAAAAAPAVASTATTDTTPTATATEAGFHIPNPVKSITDPVGAAVDEASKVVRLFLAIPAAIITAARWIANPHNWVRVVWVIGGSVGIIIGLRMLANTDAGPLSTVGRGVTRATDTVNSAAKAATLAIPGAGEAVGVARAAKAATAAKGAANVAKGAARVTKSGS